MAADLEADAVAQGVDLDTGESQLLAMLILRAANRLVTGDKRAVMAIEVVAGGRQAVDRRIVGLEQVILSVMVSHGHAHVRAKLCAEAGCDLALATCFSCGREAASAGDAAEGLTSYIGHLRASAPRVLGALT